MPVIFVTVEEALGDLAQLKRGERARHPSTLRVEDPQQCSQ